MTDNIAVEPSGHSKRVDVATDDVGGVHYPLYKLVTGADGAASLVALDNGLPCQIVGPTGNVADVDSLGHFSVVAHSHEEGGYVLFEKDISATQDFIFIDISDTTNYPHDNTNWIHVGNLIIDIAASNTADYHVHLGFLNNVDDVNGDFHQVYGWAGNKLAGRQVSEVIATSPESVKMRASSTLGTMDMDDTAFQTDVNLASTKDPATLDTPSGNGDVVLRVTVTTGSINLSVGMTYHSHA